MRRPPSDFQSQEYLCEVQPFTNDQDFTWAWVATYIGQKGRPWSESGSATKKDRAKAMAEKACKRHQEALLRELRIKAEDLPETWHPWL